VNLALNPMWPEAEKRIEAFWLREVVDRPCLQVYAPVAHAPEPSAPARDRGAGEADVVFQSQHEGFLRTSYLGEALPVLYYAWEGIAEMLGAEVERSSDTLWVRPFAERLADIDVGRIDLGHPEVARLFAVIEGLVARGAGQCFVGHPMHLGNPGDTLAKLRGYAGLCLDLHDDMGGVLRLEHALARVWNVLYDRIYDIVNARMQGSCGWLPCWHPRRSVLIEFDFCGMISPEHFARFIPMLLSRACHAERAIYHLDGPVALPHLDAILGLPEIQAVQAQPGAGISDPLSWLPVYHRIQGAGRSLYVGFDCTPAQALRLIDELDPAGLMIPVRARSEEEGHRFLDDARRRRGRRVFVSR
jgi:hypothetical protein